MKIPQPIQIKINDLEHLVQEYPNKIPVEAAAKFLGMDAQCLRRSIDQGKAPFAIGCNNGIHGNRYAHIPTATFYFWYMAPFIKDFI